MTGIKSQAKKFLISKGVRSITLANGTTIKLQNAKTTEVLKKAIQLGF